MRCLALGEAWQYCGGKVILMGRVENEALQRRIGELGILFVPLAGAFSPTDEMRRLNDLLFMLRNTGHTPNCHPWLVLDGYHFDTGYQSMVRGRGYKVCIIDDTAHLNFYDATIVLNQNVNTSALSYRCSDKTCLLIGSQFALLRRHFWDMPRKPRSVSGIAYRVLVSFGGMDACRQLTKVVRALRNVSLARLEVTLVAGFEDSDINDLRHVAGELANQHEIHIVSDVQNMPDIMARSNIAITAGGTTTLELCFMGVPMILIAIADNQLGIISGLQAAGAGIALGWYNKVSEADIATSMNTLLQETGRCVRMSQAAQQLVDGKGWQRVIHAFVERHQLS